MAAAIIAGSAIGFLVWVLVVAAWYAPSSFFSVNQNERAVKTVFGKAQRLRGLTTNDSEVSASLRESEKDRYCYPLLKVIPPGGPYFKWPWEKVHKVSVSTETVSMAYDPDSSSANQGGTVLQAVTKDQLYTGLVGQIRYQISEQNLYAYLFGIRNPIAHVMGYFVCVLRERIATFDAENAAGERANAGAAGVQSVVEGISINDLRKNLRELNDHMDRECQCSEARYGIRLDSSLITRIDPPAEVESALAAINTAHNQISSDISIAKAAADQRIVESRRAVEIEMLKAEAAVEPLKRLSEQLSILKSMGGVAAIRAYVRAVRLQLHAKAARVVLETPKWD